MKICPKTQGYFQNNSIKLETQHHENYNNKFYIILFSNTSSIIPYKNNYLFSSPKFFYFFFEVGKNILKISPNKELKKEEE
jgi:hypothetical protein